MDRARIHEGICQMRFENVIGRWERSELSQAEAAELLGVGERTFRRRRDRHRDAGVSGLRDRRLGPSPLSCGDRRDRANAGSVSRSLPRVGLTRLRGHPEGFSKGVPNAQKSSALFA